jgi:GntR family transcriptional regulator
VSLEARRLELLQALRQPDRSGRPKYQRLADTLVEAIKRGLWKPGERLPAEDELTGMTPFSLGTVQRALRDLSDQGLLVRQHGLGSFVAEPKRPLQHAWHCRFLDDDGVTVLPVYSKVIQRKAVKERGPWNTHLGSAPGEVMRLDRVVNINEEFNVYNRFYGDRSVLKRMWDMPADRLEGVNFQQLIGRHFQLPITEIKHLVSLGRFDPEAAEHCGVKPGTACVHLRAIAHAGRDLCVYYQEFYIPQTARPLEIPEHTPAFT